MLWQDRRVKRPNAVLLGRKAARRHFMWESTRDRSRDSRNRSYRWMQGRSRWRRSLSGSTDHLPLGWSRFYGRTTVPRTLLHSFSSSALDLLPNTRSFSTCCLRSALAITTSMTSLQCTSTTQTGVLLSNMASTDKSYGECECATLDTSGFL